MPGAEGAVQEAGIAGASAPVESAGTVVWEKGPSPVPFRVVVLYIARTVGRDAFTGPAFRTRAVRLTVAPIGALIRGGTNPRAAGLSKTPRLPPASAVEWPAGRA